MYGKLGAAVLAASALIGGTYALVDAKPKVVHEFRGTGEGVTPLFTIRDDWGLDWEVRGSIMWIGIVDPSIKVPPDSDANVIHHWDVTGEKTGKVTFDKGGKYRLKVFYARGPWKIRVHQYSGRID